MRITHRAVSSSPAKVGKISGPEWNDDHDATAIANADIAADANIDESKINLANPQHAHGYEPANANIQAHVTSAHAPSNAQKNSDITKAEIEAKLTGEIASHSHAGGPGGPEFPVGNIQISSNNVNPATWLGYGTWENFGTGRVLVGLDATDTDFDVAGETGGAKTHTHAGHSNHVVTQPGNHTMGAIPATGSTAVKIGTSGASAAAQTHTHAAPTITAHSGAAVDAHSAHDSPEHLMPYVVVYFWVRTA